jgi:hypothetical protein
MGDREAEGGSDGGQPQQRTAASVLEPNPMAHRMIDARHRRGSLGPPPIAAPLGEAASSAALQSHLTHLLDANRAVAAAPVRRPMSVTAELRRTPHEDPERQPDGAPHLVIGLTALCSVLFAAVLINAFRSGPTLGGIAAAVLAIIAIPVLVVRLGDKAERDRDHDHPSR